MAQNLDDRAAAGGGRLRWTNFLFEKKTRATKPIALLEIGAVVVCALALLWNDETAAARPTIPTAVAALMAASAAGQRSESRARDLMWIAALLIWLVVAMIGLSIVTG